MGKKGKVLVGLDIGTTKTCAVLGEITASGIDIVGIGSCPSDGIRKGVVVNIESTVESIKKAVDIAESASACRIRSVYAGIAGIHIKAQNSLGIVAVKGREIDEEDMERAIEAAKAIAVPLDREILHTLPQSFVVDDQDGIRNPLGMSGVRLEAKAHIVTGAITSMQNIINAVNRAGLEINEIILEQLAASEAVLSSDEKDLGVALLDIGGGTTNIAVFTEGSIKHTAVLPVGGNYITSDIAKGLRTPVLDAENIKIKYGCAYLPLIPKDENIEVPSVGGREPREVSRHILGRIVEPRVEEIFKMAYKEICKAGYEDVLTAGIVLTGGTSIMEGITELAEQVFDMPVRKGSPTGIGGLTDAVNSPVYSTAVGMILYGNRYLTKGRMVNAGSRFLGNASSKIAQWFSELF
ncbi:MAG: cell division protein FtsA [Syntrophales bacterium]|nr:cell division protein FtsA [Syntrophales bacterium]